MTRKILLSLLFAVSDKGIRVGDFSKSKPEGVAEAVPNIKANRISLLKYHAKLDYEKTHPNLVLLY